MYTILLLFLCFPCFSAEKPSENKSLEKSKAVGPTSVQAVEESDLKKKHAKLRPNPVSVRASQKRRDRMIPVWQMGPEDLFIVGEDPVLSSEEDDEWGSPGVTTFQAEK